jgi:hypothetical protein
MPNHWNKRHDELQKHHAQILAEILADLPDEDPLTLHTHRSSNGGDSKKLRGIPAIGRNVAGAIPGTTPHNHR